MPDGDLGVSEWDFFVSYHRADRVWAQWIAWQLEAAGHSVLFQEWDFVPGVNWIRLMQDGVSRSERVIVVLSDPYTDSVFGAAEWQAIWALDPGGARRRVVPVRVAECERPGLLAGIVGVDLFGVPEHEALQRLNDAVRQVLAGRAKPPEPPSFPVGAADIGARRRLASYPEDVRQHWGPRARGVSIGSEQGWRFRGRAAALRRITDWLDRRPDRRVLVVTGDPGAGKSAVLARVVTTADGSLRASMPPGDTGVMASVGSVSCAVHASGKTALEVAAEIAAAASAPAPAGLEGLAAAVREALAPEGHPAGVEPGRFSVVIDALDEAASPAEARAMIDSVVLPLAETCADAGVRVVAATRRRDDEGDLLRRFGPALDLIDLDAPGYFLEEDLAAYALACLQLARGGRPGSPYADEAAARPLAEAVARAADRNFLIAGLVARTRGMHDTEAADPARLAPVTSVRAALEGYLERLAPVRGVTARRLLTALAFAEAPGLTAVLWQLAVEALPPGRGTEAWPVQVPAELLDAFARSAAANFLVESGGVSGPGGSGGRSYRLFHQALSDALLEAREESVDRAADERALADAFTAHGRGTGWDKAPGYLLRSLPHHAGAAGTIDGLLRDDDYLLHADLRRLLWAGGGASSPDGRRRARLLRLTLQSADAEPAGRAAMFSVTEALSGLGTAYSAGQQPALYRAQWASAKPSTEHVVLESGQGAVTAVGTVTAGNRILLATGGYDGTVRLWDPATGEQTAVLQGHQSWVTTVCAVTAGDRVLLASGSDDGTVRLWDPATGEQTATLEGHEHAVYAVCAVTAGDRVLLASGSDDGTVRLWDPATGKQAAILECHQRWVTTVCAVTAGDRVLLATGSNDRTVRLWDPATGKQTAVLQGPGPVVAVCSVTAGDRVLLASGSDDTVRLWDPVADEQAAAPEGHEGDVKAVCAVTAGDRVLLATGGDDGTVRLWDPATGEQTAALESHQDYVKAVCAVTAGDRVLLATGGGDGTVRLWDPATGKQTAVLQDDQGPILAVCAVTAGDRVLLAAGNVYGHTAVLWDPATGKQTAILEGHEHPVVAVCAVTAGDRVLLATGSDYDGDGAVRLWDPATGKQTAVLEGQQGQVNAMCAVTVGSRPLLAIGGNDRMVRLLDLQTGNCVVSAPVHHAALTVAAVNDLLAIGLKVGILVIKPGTIS